jgi:glyoxylase-like metal-dependent hydrolase (beta-lactamase superfamily II)
MRFVVAGFCLLACVGAPPARAQADLVAAAVTALGGEQAMRGLNSLLIQGEAKFWEPEESFAPAATPRFLGDATFTLSWQLALGWARFDWSRSMQYPTLKKFQYSEVLTPRFGLIEDASGTRPMSATRLAVQLRELARSSPTLLLKALDNPNAVSFEGGVRVGQAALPAISLKDGRTTFIIMFDRTTHLPAIIRTFDDDVIRGDSGFDLVLSDWRDVNGVKIAHTMSYKLNDLQVARLSYSNVVANTTFGPATFAAGENLKAAAKPLPPGPVPYQTVLRQLYAGNAVDDDPAGGGAAGRLRLVELAPDVQQVVGGAQDSLIVNMRDGIAAIDAPGGEAQSRWTINAAKAKYPGKPLKYLILTHHHMDHASGVRTYVAEGATIVVPKPDKKYFVDLALRTHLLAPDALENKPVSAQITEVDEPLTLKDEGEELRLYRILNPHVDGMLIVHVVKPNIVWATDLVTPSPEATKGPGSRALGLALERYGIKDATIASGNGGSAKQSDLAGVLSE